MILSLADLLTFKLLWSHLLLLLLAWFSEFFLAVCNWLPSLSNASEALFRATGENTGECVDENNPTCSESSTGVEMRSLPWPNMLNADPFPLPSPMRGVMGACAATRGFSCSCVTFPKGAAGQATGDSGVVSWRKFCSILSTSDNPAASNSKPYDKLKEAVVDGLT